jgi:hypothetical protein
MADGDPGLLDDAWDGWKHWWAPTATDVPAGSPYDAETLGLARTNMIGALGGRLLALSQGGLQPAQRAALLGSIGEVPQVFQDTLTKGAEIRVHDAAARKAQAELTSETASNAMFDKLIAARSGGSTAGPSGNLPTGGAIQQALAALAPAESGGNAGAQNSQGYSGRYQIGSSLAADSGVYRPAPGEAVADDRGRATNQWRGTWVLPGMEPMTHEQFRANPQAQQAAAEAAMAHNWRQIQAAGLDKYVGREVGGVNITAPGLLQGAWLGGIKGLQTWLSGQGDPQDSNKTSVSKWASLQPPGGARTMTDAGGGGASEAPGGAAFVPPTKPKSIADLTPDQLILLRQMPAAQRPAKILELTTKPDTPVLLSPAQSAHLGPGTWQWSPTAGYSRLAEGQASELNAAELARLHMAPDAVVQRKGDGTLNIIDPGQTTWAGPDYLKAHQFAPDAKITVKPDGTPNVIDKGTDLNAPLTVDNARGILARHADAVRAGTVLPTSPIGQAYRAAHDLVSQQGRWVPVKRPDGSSVDTFQAVPNNFPRLGAEETPLPASVQTAPPAAETARTPQQLFSDATQARREIESGPTYTNYSNARPLLLSIRQAEPIGTGASDMQMIYGYAKILDPNSVVRGPEGDMVQRTGGVWDSIQGMIQQVKGDGKLSPAVRRNLVEQAESAFNAHEVSYKDRVDTYRSLVGRAGLNPDDVYPEVKPISKYTPPGQPMRLPGNETPDSYAEKLNAHIAKGEGTYDEAVAIARRYGIPVEKIKRR